MTTRKVCNGKVFKFTVPGDFDEDCTCFDGTGETDPNKADRFNAVDVLKVMEMVKEPMTNEEWFCRLSTEEKAKWITANLSVYADSWVKRDEKLLNPVTWEEWLKEAHDGNT